MIAPAVGGVILLAGSWRTVFFVLTLLGLVQVAAVLRGVPETLVARGCSRGARAAAHRSSAWPTWRATPPSCASSSCSAWRLPASSSTSAGRRSCSRRSTRCRPRRTRRSFAVNAVAMALASGLVRMLVGRVAVPAFRGVGLALACTGALVLGASAVIAAPAAPPLALVWPALTLRGRRDGLRHSLDDRPGAGGGAARAGYGVGAAGRPGVPRRGRGDAADRAGGYDIPWCRWALMGAFFVGAAVLVLLPAPRVRVERPFRHLLASATLARLPLEVADPGNVISVARFAPGTPHHMSFCAAFGAPSNSICPLPLPFALPRPVESNTCSRGRAEGDSVGAVTAVADPIVACAGELRGFPGPALGRGPECVDLSTGRAPESPVGPLDEVVDVVTAAQRLAGWAIWCQLAAAARLLLAWTASGRRWARVARGLRRDRPGSWRSGSIAIAEREQRSVRTRGWTRRSWRPTSCPSELALACGLTRSAATHRVLVAQSLIVDERHRGRRCWPGPGWWSGGSSTCSSRGWKDSSLSSPNMSSGASSPTPTSPPPAWSVNGRREPPSPGRDLPFVTRCTLPQLRARVWTPPSPPSIPTAPASAPNGPATRDRSRRRTSRTASPGSPLADRPRPSPPS